jgi:hypothetical protein
MPPDWTTLSETTQLALSREALCHARDAIAAQAERLAEEIESGGLADRGGPDALRLLAALMRMAGRDPLAPAGSA